MDDRPFYDDPWKGRHGEAARAVWDWHLALRATVLRSPQIFDPDFEVERVRVEMKTELVDEATGKRAAQAVEEFSLDSNLFALQVQGAAALCGSLRFDTNADLRLFESKWPVPVGRLLASLAGSGKAWQLGQIDSLSTGFFRIGRLLELPADVERGHVFIPQEEIRFFGVQADRLQSGPPDESIRKLLWKQCVRIRDQFAQALPLAQELPRRYASAFKRWWLGGLEVLNAIERRKYDLWSDPIRLGRYYRAQARFQARFGRTTFRRK